MKMLIVEKKPVALAVGVALSGSCYSLPIGRLARAQFLFPDIGRPHLARIGFLRYQGEKSFVKPEATEEELARKRRRVGRASGCLPSDPT